MNVAWFVERAARLFPGRPAILFEGRAISYAELDTRAGRIAAALAKRGVKHGDRVALFLPNTPDFIAAYLGALKAGAVAVSINAASKQDEVRFIVDDCAAVALFTVSELAAAVPAGSASLAQVIDCAELDRWLEGVAPLAKSADLAPDEPAVLLYTSGTTGAPKGATLTHGNVVSNSYATAHHAGYRQDDRMLLFLPLFHCFGQNFVMNATFAACATLVLHRRFVPDEVLASIANNEVTMFFAVPTVYVVLLNLPGVDLGSIRYEFSAAATMPQEISRRWTERFGRPVYEGYGLTECSPFACYNHDFKHKSGSVGTPVENFEIKIFDPDDRELPVGSLGEIVIRGPGVMKGYWNRPEETARALRSGWLHSGDIGRVDEEGYVFIVDRLKDMVNVSGFKVWPAEVEQALYRHPAVKEVAVYGAADAVKGEAVRAAIVLKEGAGVTAPELIAWCRERLAVYKAPERVDFVEALPKSATGKILKRVLRGG